MSAPTGRNDPGRRDGAAERDDSELAGRLAIVEAENERLREEFARIHRTRYRRTAAGLALIGVLSVIGAFLVPGARTVLLALGGTGLFAGLLTYYLTPERFIAAEVGEEIYAALAENESAMAGELGLDDARIYVPTDDTESAVRLYVPQGSDRALPDREALSSVFLVDDDDRGLSLRPTGESLFGEFERGLAEETSEDPAMLGEQLADGLVEQFELVRSATPDAESERLTLAVTGSAYGAVDRFDHPVASFVAVGVARSLDVPVRMTVRSGDDERADHLVTCVWDDEGSNAEESTVETDAEA